MDQQTKGKFIVVVMIGIVLAAIIVNNLLGGGKNKDSDFDKVEVEDSTYLESDSSIDYKNEKNNGQEQVEKLEEVEPKEPVNFEEKYTQQYGAEAVQQVKEKSQKMMELWLSGNTTKEQWEPLSTPEFLEKVLEVGIVDKPDGVIQELQRIEVYPTINDNENEMKMEVALVWNVKKGDVVIREEKGIFYVTFRYSEEKKQWLVKELANDDWAKVKEFE